MNRKLYHPLWAHLPAMIVLAAGLLNLQRRQGQWHVMLGVTIISLFYIELSFLIDELWARQENRKTFNWLSLMDEFAVAGIVFTVLRMPSLHWGYVLAGEALAVGGGVIVEFLRPYVAHEAQVYVENTSVLEREIADRRDTGLPMVYWESQNPPYVSVLVIVTSLILVLAASNSLVEFALYRTRLGPWISIASLIFAGAVLVLYGGLRVMVTPNRLLVQLGILGIRLLDIPISKIAHVEVIGFSPLRDFGGYGIRWGLGMRAFFFCGERGVLVTTIDDKRYLIGSDRPERLAAVIMAVRE